MGSVKCYEGLRDSMGIESVYPRLVWDHPMSSWPSY